VRPEGVGLKSYGNFLGITVKLCRTSPPHVGAEAWLVALGRSFSPVCSPAPEKSLDPKKYRPPHAPGSEGRLFPPEQSLGWPIDPVIANIFSVLPLLEIALVFVRLDDVASVIVNANHGIM